MSQNPARRFLTDAYKLRILREVEKCTQRGQVSALLRREGLYSSYLTAWRRQQKEGKLVESDFDVTDENEPRSTTQEALLKENERLRCKIEQMQETLRDLEVVNEARKRLTEILAILFRDDKGEKTNPGSPSQRSDS
ncbi:MAG: transposase [Pirellulales bacterium]|nr:transposase [Pirellulales bacterium]